jgi:tRNA (guanine37-N1)-methyltransferase
MIFNIITIFPEMFFSYFSESIIKRALDNEKIKINIIALRDYTEDKHKTVDDTPYGGGAGMLMKIEPLYRALQDLQLKGKNKKSKVILLSAKGRTWKQSVVREYSSLDEITMICGRYEGVDERVLEFIDEEVSIGDYILTGGEIGAMTIIDSVARLLPGVLGNDESSISESYTEEGVLEYPQYTRPEIFVDENAKEHKVPDVLLSGNHAEIEKWREGMKKKK